MTRGRFRRRCSALAFARGPFSCPVQFHAVGAIWHFQGEAVRLVRHAGQGHSILWVFSLPGCHFLGSCRAWFTVRWGSAFSVAILSGKSGLCLSVTRWRGFFGVGKGSGLCLGLSSCIPRRAMLLATGLRASLPAPSEGGWQPHRCGNRCGEGNSSRRGFFARRPTSRAFQGSFPSGVATGYPRHQRWGRPRNGHGAGARGQEWAMGSGWRKVVASV